MIDYFGFFGLAGIILSNLVSVLFVLAAFGRRFSRNGHGPDEGEEAASDDGLTPTSLLWGCALGAVVNLCLLAAITFVLYQLGVIP